MKDAVSKITRYLPDTLSPSALYSTISEQPHSRRFFVLVRLFLVLGLSLRNNENMWASLTWARRRKYFVFCYWLSILINVWAIKVNIYYLRAANPPWQRWRLPSWSIAAISWRHTEVPQQIAQAALQMLQCRCGDSSGCDSLLCLVTPSLIVQVQHCSLDTSRLWRSGCKLRRIRHWIQYPHAHQIKYPP